MGVIGTDTHKIDSAMRHKLKHFVKELSAYRGRGTELVSVYAPAGYDLNVIINQLQQEQGTAENIKSKQTRTNVVDALERMIVHLRGVAKTPPNGLAAFSGNVSEREGQSDVRVWSIEMPIPSTQRLYRCDKEFILDPIRAIVDQENTYGLVVLDRRDAMVALLKGKTIIPLVQTHSEVPGKHKSGGQCLARGTLVQTASGVVIPIENTHNPLSIKSIMENHVEDSPILDKWETHKDVQLTIITANPRCEIKSSKDHVFFVHRSSGDIAEVPAEDLRVGDTLLMPERISVIGKTQTLQKKDFIAYGVSRAGLDLIISRRKSHGLSQKQVAQEAQLGQTTISAFERQTLHLSENVLRRICKAVSLLFDDLAPHLTVRRAITLPEVLTADLARILGYFLGDGNYEADRLTFSEHREEVARSYQQLIEKVFGLPVVLTHRETKGYWQLRVYGQPIVKLLKDNFPELRKAMDSELPAKVLESPDDVVVSFVRGLFDAEGYVSGHRIGLGMNNKQVVQALQMVLLRFGIIGSFQEYDNRKNTYSKNLRFTLQISDQESLRIFAKAIGFTSSDKRRKLALAIEAKDGRNRVRQVLSSGVEVRRIIEEHGYNTQRFPRVTDFFRGKRRMSKEAFRRSIVAYAPDDRLRKKLQSIVDTPLLPTRIASITIAHGPVDMVDISVGHQNFIANGVLVHNSAVRFERLREGAIVEHFKKIAEYMKEQFLPMGNDLKGIILGGPGVTVNQFYATGYVTGEVQRKILGTKDLSYTGEFGLQELLEKSEDLLAAEEVAEEKKLMQKFFYELSKDTGLAAYGKKDVLTYIGYGAVDLILLSEDLDDATIEEFEKTAETTGAKVVLISDQTREGVQLREMGKIAAVLRYPMTAH